MYGQNQYCSCLILTSAICWGWTKPRDPNVDVVGADRIGICNYIFFNLVLLIRKQGDYKFISCDSFLGELGSLFIISLCCLLACFTDYYYLG